MVYPTVFPPKTWLQRKTKKDRQRKPPNNKNTNPSPYFFLITCILDTFFISLDNYFPSQFWFISRLVVLLAGYGSLVELRIKSYWDLGIVLSGIVVLLYNLFLLGFYQ